MAGLQRGVTQRQLRVFVSSTSEDLKAYRAAARLAILDVDWMPTMMEHFGAVAQPTVKACCTAIANSDLVLLIVAHRRGWVPGEEQDGNGTDSITALELQHARHLMKPVLVLLASDSWPGNRWEDDAEARAYVKGFRANLNQPAAFFDVEPEQGPDHERLPIFRSKVRDALNTHRTTMAAGDSERPGADMQISAVGAGLRAGSRIPLLGPDVFGEGPLSTSGLVSALGAADPVDDRCLATVAEYKERLLSSRYEFIEAFRETIEAQSRGASPAAAHQLVANFEKVPLIVSASWDRVLEQTFDRMGVGYAVISHVLRSFDGVCDGRVLVERSTGTASVHVPSELDLRDAERVIYKPMGSPVPLPGVDPALELDTVVATESDHFLLFRFLQSQQTGVPTAVISRLQRWPLVYIGYALDVWQYRLVTQVLRTLGRRSGGAAAPFAIRDPRTALEELSWRELGARVISMDPNQFASRLLTEQAVPSS